MSARELLTRIPAVYASLGDALVPSRGASTGERVSGGGNARPLPLEADVAEHRNLLLRGLRYWCAQGSILVRRRGEAREVVDRCAILISALDNFTAEQRSELETNLADWLHGSGKVASPVRLRSVVPLGLNTCPAGVETVWECDGQLRLMVPEDRTRAPWLQCGTCKVKVDATELPDAADVSLPLSDLSQLTGVPLRTLQHRVQRGSLEASGGHAKLGDVLRTSAQCAPVVAQ